MHFTIRGPVSRALAHTFFPSAARRLKEEGRRTLEGVAARTGVPGRSALPEKLLHVLEAEGYVYKSSEVLPSRIKFAMLPRELMPLSQIDRFEKLTGNTRTVLFANNIGQRYCPVALGTFFFAPEGFRRVRLNDKFPNDTRVEVRDAMLGTNGLRLELALNGRTTTAKLRRVDEDGHLRFDVERNSPSDPHVQLRVTPHGGELMELRSQRPFLS